MKRGLLTTFLTGVALSIFAAEPASSDDWKLSKQISGVAIYSRPRPGSKLKEFRAIGEIDAATAAVHRVIDDYEAYPSFMPYTAETRVIQRNHELVFVYQRISPKIVSDRDYTIRVEKKSWPTETGVAYLTQWKPANEKGPPASGDVFRVKLVYGSWLLEPKGPNKTHATYHVFTDSGIVVPAFLANKISETGITKLFAAVRKQAKEPKYQAN